MPASIYIKNAYETEYYYKWFNIYPYISAETIHIAVKNMAKHIQNLYAPEDEILVLIVLKGSFIFAADLIRHLHLRCKIEMIRASSYGDGIQSSGEIHLTIPPFDIKGSIYLLLRISLILDVL